MHIIDWLIVGTVFCFLGAIAIYTKQYMKGVSDFLAANRCAGRYLLTLADGMAGLGAIGIIATFQQFYEAGFGSTWWGGIMAPILLCLPLTGFIIYRFRETRAMTMAEFYERRYSRKFRIFTGILAFIAGVINYGVFPQVTARFLIYFCGLPVYKFPAEPISLGGMLDLQINVTLGIVMAFLLITALLITFRGGQIAIMVTDFFQAQYCNVVFLLILFVLLYKFGISDVFETMKTAAPEGKSMLNPFDQSNVQSFNMGFYLIMAFNAIYSYMAWQGNQAYNASAKTPHDAKMARILGAWRYGVTWAVIMLVAIFAFVMMNSPNFAAEAEIARNSIEALGDEGLQKQLTVPLALRQMLPVGVFGLFVAAMLAAAISTDDTYLHSWGSIFIQDVVMPFRKKRMEQKEHLKLLKRAILGVAIFVWCFGMIFPLYEYIFMYWAVTGAIYVGGAGSVIIGGFYWKRGTTAGAWAGMISGSVIAFIGVFLNNVFWPIVLPKIKENAADGSFWLNLPDVFWWDGSRIFFAASILAIFCYIFFSLITKPNPDFSFDKLLNRGKYAIEGEHQKVARKKKWTLQNIIGIDEEFTAFDKFISHSVFWWTVIWFTIFIAGTILGYTIETTDDQWATYWLWSQGVTIVIGIVSVFWFLIGGFMDLKDLFITLKTVQRDSHDDGFVDENGNGSDGNATGIDGVQPQAEEEKELVGESK